MTGKRGSKVKRPKTAAAAKAMDQLVSQFAQPLAFLRELVQNSLDASTELIEVDVDYDPEAECCFVRVRDTGIGMDRAIIDSKLTRLFSSSKEDDLTKIGKFGIGFVSIFAVDPKLVVLETGRDGESWRLLFKPDRSFERRELKTPVEGTSVTVFLPRGRGELEKLVHDCRETVAFWCRHADVEIQFNGVAINQPFQLPGAEFSFTRTLEGTEAVVAPSTIERAFHGYYNRGLTLLEEGQGSPLPHVAFKLRSRYLEHTLSRDNVLFDEGYERAMEEVKVAAYQDMPAALLEKLAQQDEARLWRLARVVLKYPEPAPDLVRKAPIFPSHGRRLRAEALTDPVYFHPVVDDFWKAAEAAGVVLIEGETGDEKANLLRDLGLQVATLASQVLHFGVTAQPSPDDADLLAALYAADKSLGRLVLIEGLHVPPPWSDVFCAWVVPESGVAVDPNSDKPGARSDAAGIFACHPFWAKLKKLYSVQPELALSLGSRKLSLTLGMGTDGDDKLFNRLVKSLRARTVPA